MKTTVILQDHLLRSAKAHAALRGWTLSRYLESCLEKNLEMEKTSKVGDWLGTLPRTPRSATLEVEEILKGAGFDDIDPDMWT
jgi:hypothetical protein